MRQVAVVRSGGWIGFMALAVAAVGALPSGALAGNGDAYSYSQEIGATSLSGFTEVAKRRVPVGIYAFTATGVIRNDSATNAAYVSCDLSAPFGVTIYVNDSEMVVPPALSPGVPGGATYAITTTVEVPAGVPGGQATIAVVCGNFGPAADADVEAWFPNIVAIKVPKDNHRTAP